MKHKKTPLWKKLKPQYRETFKTAFIWYRDHWDKHALGYKELSIITKKNTATLQEHIEKLKYRDFIRPLMVNWPNQHQLLKEVLNHFRETFSEYNPEKTHPKLFKKDK